MDLQCFNQQQKKQFDIWVLHAVVANDLFTDDSFVVSVLWWCLRCLFSLPNVKNALLLLCAGSAVPGLACFWAHVYDTVSDLSARLTYLLLFCSSRRL